MSSLRVPSFGPIVGHTTDTSSRIWIRGAQQGDRGADLDEDKRTIGVVAVTGKNGQPIPHNDQRAYYFRLHREYDRTGTFNLGVDNNFRKSKSRSKPAERAVPLEPDTTYVVRVGSLTLDDPVSNDEVVNNIELDAMLPPADVWIELLNSPKFGSVEASFKTFAAVGANDKPSTRLSFLLGSCRYPGILWKRKHADQIFGPMRQQVSDNDVSFVLMVGDQIYADMLNKNIPIGLADTYEEFQQRYHSAFGSRNMRALLRSVPNYMILDDHEIEDNWAQDRMKKRKKRMLFNIAIGAYCSYQWTHSPRNYGKRLYYNFESAGYPVFVLDGRTQRYKEDDPDELDDNHMLGRPALAGNEPGQLERVLDWLKTQQAKRGNTPKFIVTASVFAPSNVRTTKGKKQKNESDSWPAFPDTRRRILSCIVEHKVQNVVFLSGDIHCSNVAELSYSGSPSAKRLKAFSITSSAFYWPFFFADGEPSDYVHNSKDPATADTFDIDGEISMDYTAGSFTQEDNFCRIDIDRTAREIMVSVFDTEGKPVKKNRKSLQTKLALAKW